ncbi:hypothetical protein WICPIJ_008442 [Wickerhamomyces pijperi]|uniref:Histone-lysine N-methyltransferase SET5 n=1 Tax=Wickerhamomyces pijperi TaxID=599730 RepID=A0A9P8TIH0_WICPI|nr:hypothetical protein WICPIJ_008442 [Wickerhamomyces pijperi]
MGIPSIEVLNINDKPESSNVPQESVVPHEREVVMGVMAIWKADPETETLGISKLHALVKQNNPTWSLSEKRLKTVLKSFNLLTTSSQFSYANEITSKETPGLSLPSTVRLQFTKNRGKGLYAAKSFKAGDLIFEEESPLFFNPPLDHFTLMKNGMCCSYCGVTNLKDNVKRGLDCNVCSETWCSGKCKKMDKLHSSLKHNIFGDTKKKLMNSSKWFSYSQFCFDNKWMAAYAVALIHAQCIADKTGLLASQFDAFAQVSQRTRYKAIDSTGGAFDSINGGALFVKEQQEQLWEQGHRAFNEAFPGHEVSYEHYLVMLGTFNINNVDGSMFLVQSHLNHHCQPNVSVVFGDSKTDGIKVYAKRSIGAGEELLTSYVNPEHEQATRQRELRVNWGFVCSCSKCKSDIKALEKRRSDSVAHVKEEEDHRNALKALKDSAKEGEDEFDLPVPQSSSGTGERRKSVKFDEKVIAFKETA